MTRAGQHEEQRPEHDSLDPAPQKRAIWERSVLRVRIDDSDETVAWSWERPDGGRSFGFSGLHFHENWRLIEYRRLVAQAILWTLRLPVPTKGLDVRVTDKELRLP
jgi:hypothetical protein